MARCLAYLAAHLEISIKVNPARKTPVFVNWIFTALQRSLLSAFSVVKYHSINRHVAYFSKEINIEVQAWGFCGRKAVNKFGRWAAE